MRQVFSIWVGVLFSANIFAATASGAPRAVLIQPQEVAPQVGIQADMDERMTTLKHWNGFDVTRLSVADERTLTDEMIAWANLIKSSHQPAFIYYRGEVQGSRDDLQLLITKKANFLSLKTVLRQVAPYASKQPVVVVLDSKGTLTQTELQTVLAKCVGAVSSEATQLGVVLLQHDGKQQSGAIWQERSLPSYWLDRALRGAANRNGDRGISWKELTDYLETKLAGTTCCLAKVCGSKLNGRDVAALLSPSFDHAIEDLAEKTAFELHRAKTEVVALPDLDVPHGSEAQRDVPGREFGPLMRYCLEKFKRELAARSWMKYRVIQDDLLREQLIDKGIQPVEAQSPSIIAVAEAIQTRTDKNEVMMLLGKMRREGVNDLHLALTGWDQGGGQVLILSQVAPMSIAELSMIGRSAVMSNALNEFVNPPQVPPQNKIQNAPLPAIRKAPPVLANAGDLAEQVRQQQAENFEKAIRQEHPLRKKDFPFKVELRVKNENTLSYEPVPVKFSSDGRDAYVELEAKQVYAIRIISQAKSDAFLRLFVDGLNTLADYPLTTTDADSNDFVISTKDTRELAVAPIASLNNARAWICGPNSECEVRGFFTPRNAGNGGNSVVARAFLVTDASTSEAARKQYCKDIGIVTAAFYAPQSAPLAMAAGDGRLGTKMGDAIKEKVTEYDGKMHAGELLGVVHLRYGIKPPKQLTAK